ncbi:hypothetical protein CLOP_g14429 [Closterium sp. NIES-67]|nr:hypothetical protein CLOP_g14429 [Closterium sp. NIES-67]
MAGGGSGEEVQGGGDGEGDILWAHLLRGQAAWQNGGLETVASEVLPRVMLPLSWSDVEKVLEGAELAAVQRAAELALEGRQKHMGLVGGSGTLLCALTRLPIFAFTSVAAVEWYGQRYLLPVANFWASHISNASPLMLVAS